MRKWFVVLAVLTFGLSIGAQRDKEQAANDNAAPAPPSPIAEVDVEDIESVTLWRRAALAMQLVLTPADFVQQAGPLHAYDKTIVCGSDFEQTTLVNAERYGSAAIVQENGNTLSASYYKNLRDAYQALKANNNINSWCDSSSKGAYIATTLPIDDVELEHHLLLSTGGGWNQTSGAR